MVNISAAFLIVNLALLASASVLPRVPVGTQFITGPCQSDADCASDCCAFNTGKCAGAVIAQSRDGGCGHGDPFPNNRAAIAIQGPNAERAPGVPVAGQAPPPPAGGNGGGGGGGAGSVVVKPGDTCSAIAAASGTSVAAIMSANPGINAGCTNLQVGQTLNVSGGGGGGGAAPAPAPAPASAPPSNGGSGKPPGTQFITGPCGSDADCNSGCCGFKSGKCAGAIISQERDGGCSFGNPTPNNDAAKKIAGPDAEKAPGVPRI